jgi:hypothetical protein
MCGGGCVVRDTCCVVSGALARGRSGNEDSLLFALFVE